MAIKPAMQFIDRYGRDCSIQDSSLAGEDCIWLGRDEVEGQPARMHLTKDMVKALMPHLKKFLKEGHL